MFCQQVLPTVHRLRVEEIEAYNTLLRWDKPKNADKFREFTLKYIISIATNQSYRSTEGQVDYKASNKTFPTHLTTEYYLDDLTPGTTYKVNVKVDLQDAGIGDPVWFTFTTKSESKYFPDFLSNFWSLFIDTMFGSLSKSHKKRKFYM